MTNTPDSEPWRGLPPEVADLIEPELDATTDAILVAIAREVPDYARPLEGAFGRGVRTGVTEALRQFAELIRSPSGARGPGREVYVALGRGRTAPGPHPGRAAVGLSRGRARRLAAARRGGHAGGGRAGGAQPARRVDLRLHRGAVGRLGRGLLGGPLADRGRAPPPAPGAGERAAPRPPGRAGRPARRRRGGRLDAPPHGGGAGVPRGAARARGRATAGGRARRPAGRHRLRDPPGPGRPGTAEAARASRPRRAWPDRSAR